MRIFFLILTLVVVKSPLIHAADADLVEIEDDVVLPAEIDQVEEAERSDEIRMPDTLNTLGADESGNWVLKRAWWERAEQSFGELVRLNAQVCGQQNDYFALQNQVDQQLRGVRSDLKLTSSDIARVVEHLVAKTQGQVTNDKDMVGDEFKNIALANQPKLIALQNEITAIRKLERDLDGIVVRVVDQVQRCSDYEIRAWEAFKQIGRILNDETARSLAQEVENYEQNVKRVLQYLKNELKTAVVDLANQLQNKLANIQQSIQDLRSAGVDLQYELDLLDGKISVTQSKSDSSKAKSQKKSQGGWWSGLIWKLWDLLLWLPRRLLALFGIKF